MRIVPISINSNNKQNRVNEMTCFIQRGHIKPMANSFVLPHTVDSVSFGSKNMVKLLGSTLRFRSMLNIPCPYSGIKMIPVNVFGKKFTNEKIPPRIREQIKLLNDYSENMFPVEKEVFQIIKDTRHSNPTKDMQELLQSLAPKYIEDLKQEQLGIIKNVMSESEKFNKDGSLLSNDSFEKVKQILEKHKFAIESNDEAVRFKRKDLLSDLLDIADSVPEKNCVLKLREMTQNLPASSTDVGAFIIKYSRRTPREIVQRLVSPSVGSIEHIHARNPVGQGVAKGENAASNYILASTKLNNGRGNLEFYKWVRLHPEIVENMQKHFDFIIEKINKGNIKGYAWYPDVIKETIAKESFDPELGKSLIVIDTSKLKVKDDFDPTVLLEKFNGANMSQQTQKPHQLVFES